MPEKTNSSKVLGDSRPAVSHTLIRLGISFLAKLTPRQYKLLVLFVVVSVCAAVLEVASGAALAFLATLLGPQGPQGNLGRLTQLFFEGSGPAGSFRWMWAALVCAAVLLAANAFQILAFFLRTQTSFAALRLAREILVEYYFSRELGFYSKSHSSEAIAAILTESQRLYHAVLSPAVALIHAGMVALVVAASAIWIKPLAGLSAGAVFIIAYSLYYFALRPVFNRSDRISSGASRERQRILQQGFEGMREFLFWGRRSLLLDDFRRVDSRATRGEAVSLFFSHIPRNVLEILIILSALACGFFVPRGSLGQISLGEVVFYGFAMLRLLPAMQQIFSSLAQLQMGRSALEPVLLAAKSVRQLPSFRKSNQAIPAPLSEFGLLNVSFRYEEARGWALRHVNLQIPVGALVALVGPTGSGKSTAADLLAGLLCPVEGCLAADGNPVPTENYPSWRRHMAYLPQHFYILDAPVEENLAFCSPHLPLDRPRLEEAARGAQIDEFIRSLPMGYQEPLGERGVRLSGGQRQRLGIARVLYSQAPILLLDEPTSALDPRTEEGILETIRTLRGTHTIILITHREAAWKKCDMVYRFEKGVVMAEAGSTLSPLPAS